MRLLQGEHVGVNPCAEVLQGNTQDRPAAEPARPSSYAAAISARGKDRATVTDSTPCEAALVRSAAASRSVYIPRKGHDTV